MAIPYLPVAVTHVVLVVLALRDLVRPERQVRGDNKGAWGIFIVVAELAGPIIYFAVGRKPLGAFSPGRSGRGTSDVH